MKSIITSLEITGTSIRLARIETGETAKLLCIEKNEYSGNRDLTEKLSLLEQKLKLNNGAVVIALPRAAVFFKKITLPPASINEIEEMLPFEAEKYLPFSSDQAVYDFYHVNDISESSSNDIYLIAAKKEVLDKQLDILQKAGIKVDYISVTPIGLLNVFKNLTIKHEPLIFPKFETSFWEIDIIHNNALIISRGGMVSNEISMENFQLLIKDELSTSINMFYSLANIRKTDPLFFIKSFLSTEIIKKTNTDSGAKLTEVNLEKNNFKINIPVNISLELINESLPLIGLCLPSYRQVNLIPADIRTKLKRKRTQNKRFKIASAFISILLLAVCAIFINNYSSYKHGLVIKNIIGKNKAEIIVLSEMDKKLNIINKFTANNTLPLAILKEISQKLPPAVYVRQLNYDETENTVTIYARAVSHETASKAALKLSESKIFINLTNKGSYITKMGDTNLVDFELTASLRN